MEFLAYKSGLIRSISTGHLEDTIAKLKIDLVKNSELYKKVLQIELELNSIMLLKEEYNNGGTFSDVVRGRVVYKILEIIELIGECDVIFYKSQQKANISQSEVRTYSSFDENLSSSFSASKIMDRIISLEKKIDLLVQTIDNKNLPRNANELIIECHNLIRLDQTMGVFPLLFEHFQDDPINLNQVILLNSRWSRITKEKRQGLLEGQPYYLENVRITHAILDFLEVLKEN